MRLRVSVGRVLTREVPSLHDTLEALTLAGGLDVDELPDVEVAGS